MRTRNNDTPGFEPARARLRAARYSAAPTTSYYNPNRQFPQKNQSADLAHIWAGSMIPVKLFGQEARNAVRKEMQQHHNTETYIPVNPPKLMYEEKREAVKSLCNLIKKRCGRVKARQCGRGDMQKKSSTYTKEDVYANGRAGHITSDIFERSKLILQQTSL